MSATGHMTFQRFGRSHHLRINRADHLRFALELDPALWVASSVPMAGLHCDETFLKLLDSTGNGRVVCGELASAIPWLLDCLADLSGADLHNAIVTNDQLMEAYSLKNATMPDGTVHD